MSTKKRARTCFDSIELRSDLIGDATLLQSFKIGAAFTEHYVSPINSIHFHRSEPFLITASDDDCVQLYNARDAKHLKTISSGKYGCQCVTYTHHINCVLIASTKGMNHAVRYLSLHDNRWLRYFDGHSKQVTSISMSPQDDCFITAGEDQEVRLWDLRTVNCQAMVKCPGIPCCAYDEQGLVFGATSDCGVIKLFDSRQYDKGPFEAFAVKDENCSVVPFSSLKFSCDGQKILAVNQGCIYIVDAFSGNLLVKIDTGTSQRMQQLEASFTPDAKHVIGGCHDQKIRIWDINKASEQRQSYEPIEPVVTLEGHTQPVRCIKWSPRMAMFASSCQSLALWIPDKAKVHALERES